MHWFVTDTEIYTDYTLKVDFDLQTKVFDGKIHTNLFKILDWLITVSLYFKFEIISIRISWIFSNFS